MQDSPNTIPVIIIGEGISALGTLRALQKYHIKSFLDCPLEDKTRYSRWYNHLDFLSNDRSTINFEALAALPYQRMVLMPCADRYVLQVAEIPDEYNDRFLTSTGSVESLLTLIDKAKFAEQVNKTKINAPMTIFLNRQSDLESLPDSAFEEAFLKPVDSPSFLSAFGVKAVRVDSREDALAKFAAAQQAGCDVMLQKYIAGPSSNHYFIDGFRDREGNITATFARRRLRIYPADFGNSCFMRSVPKNEVQSGITDLQTLLDSIDYRGIFSAEFKLDEKDGILKIIEINSRAWMYVEFAAACGINTPWFAYQDALGIALPVITENYPVGAKCAYPYADLSGYRDKTHAQLGFFEMLGNWFGAKQPVFKWSDPWPAWVNIFSKARKFIASRVR